MEKVQWRMRLPRELHAALLARAWQHQRSLHGEMLAILAAAVGVELPESGPAARQAPRRRARPAAK